MIKNYLLVAWRNLIRNKAFSAINIMGLALGICCALFIMLWIADEGSVDKFHVNKDLLYQVYERNHFDGKVQAGYPTPGLLAQELKRNIPEIEYASAMEPVRPFTFEANDKPAKMEGSYAGADFFKMFSYPLLEGNASNALNTVEAVAISRKMAEQFFGSAGNAIGKTIKYENRELLAVTAVFENIPNNSSVKFDWLRSWEAFLRDNAWAFTWGSSSPVTFIQLRKNADPEKTEARIKDFVYRYIPKNNALVRELAFQPYAERYLHSSFKNGYVDGGRIEYVRLFSAVGIFILLIACINFMNLATARAAKRAKEIGVRKVIGALRSTLIGQFTGEALVLTFFSFLIALLLTAAFLPAFNTVTGKEIDLPFTEPVFWAALLGLLIITGFVAGSYPALFLSSLKPVKVLKGSLKFSSKTVAFRKGLVILQFTLTIVLIVGMIVIYRQMDYTQKANLGYDRENLVYIPVEGDLITQCNLFKQRAEELPGILSVSRMRNSPTVIEHHTGDIKWPGKDPNLNISFADAVVDYDFVQTLKLQLREGRDFSKDFGTDSTGFLINETAAERMGISDPVGKPVSWGRRQGTIIGVLRDFHFNSLHQQIDPLIVRLDENLKWGTILVRTQAGKTREAIGGLENLSRQLNPRFPFSFQFSDEEYTRLYKNEQTVSTLSNVFAALAIFISCLGLFGLATFAAAQRTREIGIRKVLGASVTNITALLSVSFLKPVAMAVLIAFPLANYIMQQWLEDFAYKVDMEWWMFVFAGALTLMIALLTVSYQSIRAALLNPVKSIKTE
jgi:putative ABC transport system permease protein